MRLRRLLLASGLLLASALGVAACSDSDDDIENVVEARVGIVQSLTGAAGIYGASVVAGIELAVDEINAAEAGLHLTTVTEDDQSTVEGGRTAFEALVDQDVTAILGPTLSNVALEDMKIAQGASIPVLGVTTTAQGITEIGDYVFRVALTEAVVVPATIARVHEEVIVRRAVLIFDSSDAFSRSSADAMRTGLEAIDGELVSEIDVANVAIEDGLATLDENGFDTFLVTPLVVESVTIMEAIRDAGYQKTVIGGNSFNTLSIAEDSHNAVQGAYVGAAWNPALDTGASRRFVDAYMSRYGTAPDLFAAQGYSAVYLLREALLRAGTAERSVLRDALAAIDGVGTPMGNITMTETREATYEPVVQRFESGQLVVLP